MLLDYSDKMQLPGWPCCTWLLLLLISCKSPGSESGCKLEMHTSFFDWSLYVHHTVPPFSWPGLRVSNKHHACYGSPVLGHKNLMIYIISRSTVGFHNLLPDAVILRKAWQEKTVYDIGVEFPSTLATPTLFQRWGVSSKNLYYLSVSWNDWNISIKTLPKTSKSQDSGKINTVHTNDTKRPCQIFTSQQHNFTNPWPGRQSVKPVAIDGLWSSCLHMHYLRCPMNTKEQADCISETVFVCFSKGVI